MLRRLAALVTFSAVAALSLVGARAGAQQIPGPPPIFNPMDANGVNLGTGAFSSPAMPTLSIGRPGAGGLSYSEMLIGPGNWLSNLDGTVTTNASSQTVVAVGFNAEEFTVSGGTYTSVQGTGSTLSLNGAGTQYTYTDRLGVVYTYSAIYLTGTTPTAPFLLTSVHHPNGETDTFTYATASYTSGSTAYMIGRLQSVTNNFGYQIQIQYSTNTLASNGSNENAWLSRTVVTAINNAVDYCSPTAFSCSGFTVTWPTLTYTAVVAGSEQTITDAMSRVTTLYYDASYGLTEIKKPSGVTIAVAYYPSTGLVSQVQNGAGTWAYTETPSTPANTNTVVVTDPVGNVSRVVSNLTTGQVESLGDPLGATSYTLDAFQRVTNILHPSGNQTKYTYDSETPGVTRGNIVTVTEIPITGSGLSNITTSASYDPTCTYPVKCNKPNSTTDGNSHTTNYSYDTTYGVLTKVDPPVPTGSNQPEKRYAYTQTYAYYKNSSGSIVQAATPIHLLTSISRCQSEAPASCPGTADEVKTTITYGTTGVANNLLPTSITKAAGGGPPSATSSMTYDNIGDPATVVGPLGSGQTSAYLFDANREQTGVIGPNPGNSESLPYPAIRVTYNSDGLVTEVEDGTDTSLTDTNWSTFTSAHQQITTYDVYDRPSKFTWSGGGTTYNLTQYTYDLANRVSCAAARMNPSVFSSPPSSACDFGTEGPNGNDRVTQYSYNGVNEVTSAIVADGDATQAVYDTLTYASDRQVVTELDANGNLTTYTYDGFRRPSQVNFPVTTLGEGASDSTDYETYGYDNNSNLTSLRRRSGDTISYSYDVLNRVTEKVVPTWSGQNVYYSYDLLNRLTAASYGSPTGAGVSYAYDALSRATSETAGGRTLASQYDAAGDRTQITWPDGFYVNYVYDYLQRPFQVEEEGATSGVGLLAKYTYDGLRRLTAIARAGGAGASTSIGYDNAGRISSLTQDFTNSASDVTWSFTYDAANAVLTRTATNDSYTNHPGAQTQTYVANGLNQYASRSGTSFTYDSRGNLTSDGARTFTFDVDNKLLTGSAPTAVTFTYDPLARAQTDTASSATTTFLYDGMNLSAEYNSAGTVLRRYIPSGLGVDQPLVWYEGSGTTSRRWLHTDNQASIAAYSDTSGNEDAAYGYGPNGEPGSWTGSRYSYTGQLMIPESNLYNYKVRAYDPQLGRFLQVDPVGYANDLNAYSYAGNNSPNISDPSGEIDIPVVTSCVDCSVPAAAAGAELYGGNVGAADAGFESGACPGGAAWPDMAVPEDTCMQSYNGPGEDQYAGYAGSAGQINSVSGADTGGYQTAAQVTVRARQRGVCKEAGYGEIVFISTLAPNPGFTIHGSGESSLPTGDLRELDRIMPTPPYRINKKFPLINLESNVVNFVPTTPGLPTYNFTIHNGTTQFFPTEEGGYQAFVGPWPPAPDTDYNAVIEICGN